MGTCFSAPSEAQPKAPDEKHPQQDDVQVFTRSRSLRSCADMSFLAKRQPSRLQSVTQQDTTKQGPPAAASERKKTTSHNISARSKGAVGGSKKIRDDSAFYVLRKTEDVRSKYFIMEMLGKGQFGVVSVALDRHTGHKYAIKSMNKRRTELSHYDYCKDIRTEVEILYHLSGHPNIIQLHGVYEDSEDIHLIMELCEGGDWFEQLLVCGTYTERQAAITAKTLLETLAYIHSLGVVHRDIKPENMLLTDRTPNADIKLADFGLSAMLQQNADQSGPEPLMDAVGSTFYVAPEVLQGHGYGKECDVWSLGVVLFIALGGYPPFDGPNEQQIFNSIMHKPLRFAEPSWKQISHGAKNMISRMLCKDPERRATIAELLAHPWMAANSRPPSGSGQIMPDPANPLHAPDVPVPDAVVSRLQHFAAMNAFKKEARKVLATYLPEEEVVGLLNIFKSMDTDSNGTVTLKEFEAALHAKGINLPEKQTKALLDRADLNRDGVIDYEEFLAATVHHLRLEKEELLWRAFKEFDKDGSGFITEDELAQALAYQGTKVNVKSLLAEMDHDGDGRINYEEFAACLRAHQEAEDDGHILAALLTEPNSPTTPRTLLNSSSSLGRARLVNMHLTSNRSRASHNGTPPKAQHLNPAHHAPIPGTLTTGRSVRFVGVESSTSSDLAAVYAAASTTTSNRLDAGRVDKALKSSRALLDGKRDSKNVKSTRLSVCITTADHEPMISPDAAGKQHHAAPVSGDSVEGEEAALMRRNRNKAGGNRRNSRSRDNSRQPRSQERSPHDVSRSRSCSPNTALRPVSAGKPSHSPTDKLAALPQAGASAHWRPPSSTGGQDPSTTSPRQDGWLGGEASTDETSSPPINKSARLGATAAHPSRNSLWSTHVYQSSKALNELQHLNASRNARGKDNTPHKRLQEVKAEEEGVHA
mmetsp:Transcript_24682/g.53878  ORF Transcript_24682/g.53878 Transcript_24682/m.53878 type:complete len:930 (+) Transcript_24682:237-3026(+)|eukprot:CAMPEP_0202899138 /NCGR_PEP_ID=MMETSP1392-20130828/7451_1 /ASSEMBLY_ACC=CAM_ASM_000868 /TAXON_ID=225041 /ORGANISM="Chlamydomonas chlamydogama, Strain SAG 11-48b" /LENGTH=929 /DNA_ID=CAMNT_0049585247 /DNA_START=180 /DNA_END=2972 /DNA_ORIENTATION=+